MRKLKLEIDKLTVESFAADAHSIVLAGTVDGLSEVENPDPGSMWECEGGGGHTEGTCIGPTYCCAPTWRPTCGSCAYTCSCAGFSQCPQHCDLY